jgi:hypothetical protein
MLPKLVEEVPTLVSNFYSQKSLDSFITILLSIPFPFTKTTVFICVSQRD